MSARAPRLLVLCSQGGMGGTQRVAILVSAYFQRLGWHVRTIFPDVPEGDDREANVPLLRWAREHGVEAETSPAMLHRAAHRTVASMRALRRLVREERPDVVNLHYGWSQIPARDILAVRLARPKRVAVSLHLPVGWDVAGEHARSRTRMGARLVDAIVPCSDPVRDVVAEAGVPASKLHVVPGGIRPPEHETDRVEARRSLGLPADAFVVGSIARMVPEKGHPDLIQAFLPLLLGDGPEAHLLLQGDGPDRPAVEALARDALGDRVHFLPEDADTALTYAASDVFALPSYAEGWPLVVMEAAFHGLPTVGTRVGGVAGQVEHGVTGLLVEPGDAVALGSALRLLRTDAGLRKGLGEAARERAYREFTDAVMGERYERVFNLKGRHGGGRGVLEREEVRMSHATRTGAIR